MEDYIKRSKSLKYYYTNDQNPKMSGFYALALFRGVEKTNRKMVKHFGNEMLNIYMKKNESRKRSIQEHRHV